MMAPARRSVGRPAGAVRNASREQPLTNTRELVAQASSGTAAARRSGQLSLVRTFSFSATNSTRRWHGTVPISRMTQQRLANVVDFPIARQRKRYWEASPGNGLMTVRKCATPRSLSRRRLPASRDNRVGRHRADIDGRAGIRTGMSCTSTDSNADLCRKPNRHQHPVGPALDAVSSAWLNTGRPKPGEERCAKGYSRLW